MAIWGLEGVTSQEEMGHWGRAFRFQGSHHFELALLVCGWKCELSDVAGVPGLPDCDDDGLSFCKASWSQCQITTIGK